MAAALAAEWWWLPPEGYAQRYGYTGDQYQSVGSLFIQLIITSWHWFRSWFDHDTITTLAIVATAIFTGTLWRATNRLWQISQIHAGHAEQAIKVAEETAKRQLRAYVFVTGAEIQAADDRGRILPGPQPVQPGIVPVAEIEITNTGQTPAYDLSHHVRIGILDWPIMEADIPPLDVTISGSKNSYGPGSLTTRFERCETALTAADAQALRNGTKAVIVYGEIKYRDIFGKQQWTRYRYFTVGLSSIQDTRLAAHARGNEAS
jgi:hypothetical protein